MFYDLSRRAFHDESACVGELLESCSVYRPLARAIESRAGTLVERLRGKSMGLSVEGFLQEYGLTTPEGAGIMCLAEALLRIPDHATADRLIESTFSSATWESHLGHSDSLFINASSWGLVLTGKTLSLAAHAEDGAGGMLSRLAKKYGEPVIREALRKAMKLMAGQFVLGETITQGLARAAPYTAKSYRFSYDMLGEGARSMAQAEAYLSAYHSAIEAVGKARDPELSLYAAPSISIKLTALHPKYEWRHRAQLLKELLPKLVGLAEAAHAHNLCIAIDAEEQSRFDLGLLLYDALVRHPALRHYHGIGYVLQAYGKRAYHTIPMLAALAQETGKRLPVRLVKGAYWDSEIKAAQIAGLPDYPVFTRKAHSDLSYLACARRLLDRPECFFPQFATHNAVTIAAIEAYGGNADYEFQRLHGMGEALYAEVISQRACRIYAPIGEHKDLLAYLIRRLLENGANSSFVHLMLDRETPIAEVLVDPIMASERSPDAGILPPAALYAPHRRNSQGLDFGNAAQMDILTQQLAAASAHYPATPAEFTAQQTLDAITQAQEAFAAWANTPVAQRAAIMEKAADLLEARQSAAMARIIQEGGRTWADALSEVREAADFCRYYAARARELFATPLALTGPTGESNTLSYAGRGVFACISPWNFPCAIFTGQVVAALVCGNCVIAKPAEQTPRTAALMVELLHQAGVPTGALILAPGAGEVVGSVLSSDERIAGIAFTGGTQTAKIIQRQLAAREGAIVPFIAETGGFNAMIVDSSALIEQAVDDIVTSAFGSAGQRCSSLRLLCVHRDIADALIGLLAGAIHQLCVGDASDAATDIGPVIDANAQAALQRHIVHLETFATKVAEAPLPAHPPVTAGTASERDACFVSPQAWEITSLSRVREEIFGPILHIYRYDPEEFDAMLAQIQSTGYGLTFGIHSRIADVYQQVTAQMRVGNCYVNRSMIGATVGVQPFGGEGLSGTGPKAGGPHYLLRFVNERTLTINTAAIGGNVELLVG